jgi:hypothetical protein
MGNLFGEGTRRGASPACSLLGGPERRILFRELHPVAGRPEYGEGGAGVDVRGTTLAVAPCYEARPDDPTRRPEPLPPAPTLAMGKADIALRHVTRQHPEDLARGLLPPGLPFEVIGWFDTQLTLVERRSDKALDLRVAGARRLLHVELAADMEADLPDRVDEYNGLLVFALRVEASRAPSRPKPLAPEGSAAASPKKPWAPVPVHSVVILLRGRREPWPEDGEYGTGWPELPWSGTRFRIEAVYQRSVAELRARGGPLWLVFTPLATDATAAAMGEVLDEIRGRVQGEQERGVLFEALLLMANLDPWGHNLKEEIMAMLLASDPEVMELYPTLREAFDKGEQRGEQKILRGLFAEQAGRAPTPDEQEALVKRAHELGAEAAVRALLKLHGDALAGWLLGNGAAPERAG